MYLLDTNALIILLYGDVAGGKLSEESLNIIRLSDISLRMHSIILGNCN